MPHLSNFISLQPHVAWHTVSFTVCKWPRKLSFDPKQTTAQAQREVCAQFPGVITQCSMWHLDKIPCQRQISSTAPHGDHGTATRPIPHPTSRHLPEVGRKLELVAHVVYAPAKEWCVHCHEDPFVACSLRALHEGFGNLPVLVHVKLQPVKASWSCFSHFFNGRGGPGAQHHPCPHCLAGWRNRRLYLRLSKTEASLNRSTWLRVCRCM